MDTNALRSEGSKPVSRSTLRAKEMSASCADVRAFGFCPANRPKRGPAKIFVDSAKANLNSFMNELFDASMAEEEEAILMRSEDTLVNATIASKAGTKHRDSVTSSAQNRANVVAARSTKSADIASTPSLSSSSSVFFERSCSISSKASRRRSAAFARAGGESATSV